MTPKRASRSVAGVLVVSASGLLLAGCAASSSSPPDSLPVVSIPLEPPPPPPEDDVARPAFTAAPAPSPPPQLPDPPASSSSEQVELELVYERGVVTVRSVTPRTFPQPVATARRLGRFAVELWVGEELLERVRFDFPLLGAFREGQDLDDGLVTSQKVLVPALERARRAVLVDRSTGKKQELPWPPEPSPAPSAKATEGSSPVRPTPVPTPGPTQQ